MDDGECKMGLGIMEDGECKMEIGNVRWDYGRWGMEDGIWMIKDEGAKSKDKNLF